MKCDFLEEKGRVCIKTALAILGAVAFIAGIAVVVFKVMQRRKYEFCDDDDIDDEYCDENGCYCGCGDGEDDCCENKDEDAGEQK